MFVPFKGAQLNISRIGILTGGGDCAGLHAVMAGLARRIHQRNESLIQSEKITLIGLPNGWASLVREITDERMSQGYRELDLVRLEQLFDEPGTCIGTSRTNIFSEKNVENGLPDEAIKNIRKLQLDCLCALGGDDTLGAAHKLSQMIDIPMLGAPKTMDNDLFGTEKTFGFESAYAEAARIIRNIKKTAESHKRIFVIEVMGRHAGWVALYAGVAAGAGVTLLPEEECDLEALAKQSEKMMEKWGYGTIVVSEGACITSHSYSENLNMKNRTILAQVISDPKNAVIKARLEKPDKVDSFGHPVLSGVGEIILAALEYLTKHEFRYQNCGHAIRSVQCPQDTVLGLRFGDALFNYIESGTFGVFPALRSDKIIPVPLSEARGGRFVTPEKHADLIRIKNLIDFY